MVYQNGKTIAMTYVESVPAIDVDDYDTEDGWHVRKYSDGYIEMRITKFYPITQDKISNNGDIYYATDVFPHIPYPVPLVERYCETASNQPSPGSEYAGWVGARGIAKQYDLTQTMAYTFYRPSTFEPVFSNSKLGINITVTGRWKPRENTQSVSAVSSVKEPTVTVPEAVSAKASSATATL